MGRCASTQHRPRELCSKFGNRGRNRARTARAHKLGALFARWVLSLCSPSSPRRAAAGRTSLVRQAGTTTTSSTTTTAPATTVPAVSPVTVAPRPGCPPVPARVGPAPDRPRYALTVHVDLPQNTVDGDLKVRFTPDIATDRL